LDQILKGRYTDESLRTAMINKMVTHATSDQWKSIYSMFEKTKETGKPSKEVIDEMEKLADEIHNTQQSKIDKPMVDASKYFNDMTDEMNKKNEQILLKCER
jgi:hypothetical protein